MIGLFQQLRGCPQVDLSGTDLDMTEVLLSYGAFTPQGEFLELPELDMARLEAAWQEAVFTLYLGEGKIEPEVVENMRSWQHSGLSRPSLRDGARQSVYLPAGSWKKGSGTNCAQHPSGRSGNWYLTPFPNWSGT